MIWRIFNLGDALEARRFHTFVVEHPDCETQYNLAVSTMGTHHYVFCLDRKAPDE